MLSREQEEFLLKAVKFLESPSLIMKLADAVGKPLELAQKTLPPKAQKVVQSAVSKSLQSALEVAIASIATDSGIPSESWGDIQRKVQKKSWMHVAATTATGAIGGFFGAMSLPLELPISTTLMLRSISEVAMSYGTDLNKMENRLECLYVFTLGTKGKHDDAMESSYLSSRLAFAQAIRSAAEFLAMYSSREVLKALEKGTAPAVLQFITRLAAYFEIAVTEKLLAEAVPFVGALGGAAINAGFTDFFNEAARFHFGMKRLERDYGELRVREEYERALRILKINKSY